MFCEMYCTAKRLFAFKWLGYFAMTFEPTGCLEASKEKFLLRLIEIVLISWL